MLSNPMRGSWRDLLALSRSLTSRSSDHDGAAGERNPDRSACVMIDAPDWFPAGLAVYPVAVVR